MSDVDSQIEAYLKIRPALERDHMGKWVVMHNLELVGLYGSFEDAANDAVVKFGRGPFLIRQVGAPQITLPASVVFQPIYA